MAKIKAITLIQIICSLLIVNYHTAMLDVPILSNIAKFGFVFNTIFVFFSGYLLTKSYSNNEMQSFFSFFSKRIKRIYPAFHLTLLLILIYCLVQNIPTNFLSFAYWSTGLGYFLPNNEIFGNAHLWFVSVILICYILFKPTYKIMSAFPYLFLIFIISSIVFLSLYLYGDLIDIYQRVNGNVIFRFLYHYFVFSFAVYWQLKNRKLETVNSVKIVGFVIALITYIYFYSSSIYSGITIISAFILSIILISIIYNLSSLFEKNLAFIFILSPITYELYLIHYPVITAINEFYHGQFISYILTFAISIPLAFLLHKTSIKLLDVIEKKYSNETIKAMDSKETTPKIGV